MSEIQDTERTDYLMSYLQDLVQRENEREVESPLHIRFGEEEES